MATGTAALSGIYYLLGDRLDGEPPMNPQARDLWEKDGHKRDSLRVGNANVPLEMFGQFGTLLKAMARYQTTASNISYEADDDPDKKMTQMAAGLAMAVADSLISDHWVSNIADGMAVVKDLQREDSPRAVYSYASKLAAGFIPGGVKQQVTKRLDPQVKSITNPLEAFISKVPMISKTVEPKIDLWGQPMHYDHHLDADLASKLTGKDPVSVEMRRIRMKIPETRRMQGGVRMTPQEFRKFLEYSGQGAFGMPPLRDEIVSRMNSPIYKAFASDAGRAEYIRDAIHMYRAIGRDAVVQDKNFSLGKRIQQKQQQDAKKMEMN